MKNIKKVPQDKTLIYIIPAVTTLTYFLISTFLSGKIIEIPHGTTKGAIISGIGVIVITIIMIAVGVGAIILIIRRNKKG